MVASLLHGPDVTRAVSPEAIFVQRDNGNKDMAPHRPVALRD
jgi:hypothetical protein